MRQPKPWCRASKNAWYVEHHFRQHRLGEHSDVYPPPKKTKSGWNAPQAILDAFYKLMATDPANLPSPETIATRLLCDLFLDHSHKNHSPACYENYRHFLQSFCDAYGRLPAAEVRPFHVTRWLDAHPGWNGGRWHAVIAVERAFSWADQQDILTPNLLRTVKAERVRRRTRVLTRAELAEILGAIRNRQFREFMQAMLEAGCRPSEFARVTAADVRLNQSVWVFGQHKTARKTHRPRVVYLTPAMVELARKLVAQYAEGPLFRGPRGKAAFTRQNIRCRFRRLRAKLPHSSTSSATTSGTPSPPRRWSTASGSPRWPSCSGTAAPRWSAGPTGTWPSRSPTCARRRPGRLVGWLMFPGAPLLPMFRPGGTSMTALRLTARDRDTLAKTARHSPDARQTRRALALLDLDAGEAPAWNRHTFQEHLRSVRSVWRGWDIVLLLDRGSPHTAGASRERAADLGVELRFPPAACPELNPVGGLVAARQGPGAGQPADPRHG